MTICLPVFLFKYLGIEICLLCVLFILEDNKEKVEEKQPVDSENDTSDVNDNTNNGSEDNTEEESQKDDNVIHLPKIPL